MKPSKVVSWVVFIAGFLYFFVPLIATLVFSLSTNPAGRAYSGVFADSKFFGSLSYSALIGALTIVFSILIIVPTAYWVRLRLPQLRPFVEFVTLLPFVIPPVILVFGLIHAYGGTTFLPLANSDLGDNVLLVAAYVVLSLPYMYRSVDAGLRAIDVRTITEASQSLGAGWIRILWQIILPNLRVALLSGVFLTFAIVIGEYTIATFLVRPAFGPYLSLLGQDNEYQSAAVSLISFALTWIAMGLINVIGRRSRNQVQVAGLR
jgi:putative spermidine/putrescine transport system permease protein